MNKAPDAFRTIGEVAAELDLPQHVLRFWESQFPHVKPLKRAGGRRYYRPEDIDLLRGIRRLLYGDGYTIKGVQRILREQGLRAVQSVGQGRHDSDADAAEIDDGDDTDEAVDANGRADRDGIETDDDHDDIDTDDDRDDADGDDVDDDDAPGVHRKVRPRQLGSLRRRPRAGSGTAAATDPARARSAGAADAAGGEAAPGPVAAGRTVPGRMMPGLAMSGVAIPGVAMPAFAERDLERLRQVLAGLEACRRLLEKAVDGH